MNNNSEQNTISSDTSLPSPKRDRKMNSKTTPKHEDEFNEAKPLLNPFFVQAFNENNLQLDDEKKSPLNLNKNKKNNNNAISNQKIENNNTKNHHNSFHTNNNNKNKKIHNSNNKNDLNKMHAWSHSGTDDECNVRKFKSKYKSQSMPVVNTTEYTSTCTSTLVITNSTSADNIFRLKSTGKLGSANCSNENEKIIISFNPSTNPFLEDVKKVEEETQLHKSILHLPDSDNDDDNDACKSEVIDCENTRHKYSRKDDRVYDKYCSISRKRPRTTTMMTTTTTGSSSSKSNRHNNAVANYPKSAIPPTCTFQRQDYNNEMTNHSRRSSACAGDVGIGGTLPTRGKLDKRGLVKSLDLFNFVKQKTPNGGGHNDDNDRNFNMKTSSTSTNIPGSSWNSLQRNRQQNIYYPIPAKYRRGSGEEKNKYLGKIQARVKSQLDKLEEKCKRSLHKSPPLPLTKNYDIDDFIAATASQSAAATAAQAAQAVAADNNKFCDRPNHNKFLYKSYKSEIDLTKNLTYLDAFLDEKFDDVVAVQHHQQQQIQCTSATNNKCVDSRPHRRTKSYSKNTAAINQNAIILGDENEDNGMHGASSSLSSCDYNYADTLFFDAAAYPALEDFSPLHRPYKSTATSQHYLYGVEDDSLDHEVATAFSAEFMPSSSSSVPPPVPPHQTIDYHQPHQHHQYQHQQHHHHHSRDLLSSNPHIASTATNFHNTRRNRNSANNTTAAMLLINNKELTYHENYLDHYSNSNTNGRAVTNTTTNRKSNNGSTGSGSGSGGGLYSSSVMAGSGSTSSSSGGGSSIGTTTATNNVPHRNVIVTKSKKQRELVVEYEC